MDLNKLTIGDKVVGVSAIVFLIATFLPWYGIDLGPGFGTASNSGWDYFLTGILPLLLAILMVAQIAISKFSTTQLPQPPIPWPMVHLILGAIIAVLLILRTIIGSDEGSGGFEIDLDRMYGLFVALIAALGLAAGGFLKSKEPDDTRVGGGPGYPPPGPGGGYPPPPPGQGGPGYPQQF